MFFEKALEPTRGHSATFRTWKTRKDVGEKDMNQKGSNKVNFSSAEKLPQVTSKSTCLRSRWHSAHCLHFPILISMAGTVFSSHTLSPLRNMGLLGESNSNKSIQIIEVRNIYSIFTQIMILEKCALP